MRFFAKDIIEAAKSDRAYDADNAKDIADYHNIPLAVVREEIVFVRKHMKTIDPDFQG